MSESAFENTNSGLHRNADSVLFLQDMMAKEGMLKAYVTASRELLLKKNTNIKTTDDFRWQRFVHTMADLAEPTFHGLFQRYQQFKEHTADSQMSDLAVTADRMFKLYKSSLPLDIAEQITTHYAPNTEASFVAIKKQELTQFLNAYFTLSRIPSASHADVIMTPRDSALYHFKVPMRDQSDQPVATRAQINLDNTAHELSVVLEDSISVEDLKKFSLSFLDAIKATYGPKFAQHIMLYHPDHQVYETDAGIISYGGRITQPELSIVFANEDVAKSVLRELSLRGYDNLNQPITYGMKQKGLSYTEAEAQRDALRDELSGKVQSR